MNDFLEDRKLLLWDIAAQEEPPRILVQASLVLRVTRFGSSSRPTRPSSADLKSCGHASLIIQWFFPQHLALPRPRAGSGKHRCLRSPVSAPSTHRQSRTATGCATHERCAAVCSRSSTVPFKKVQPQCSAAHDSYQPRDEFTTFTTFSMIGTSISTSTTVASAASRLKVEQADRCRRRWLAVECADRRGRARDVARIAELSVEPVGRSGVRHHPNQDRPRKHSALDGSGYPQCTLTLLPSQ